MPKRRSTAYEWIINEALNEMPLVQAMNGRKGKTVEEGNSEYLRRSITRQGALDAVDRILRYGRNELGEPLQDTLWFRDQLRLTADDRLSHVATSGASQVSKSLGNYLVAIDTLISGQLSIGWFYASRQSMFNQQPEQFQKMAGHWLVEAGKRDLIQRESVTRYSVGVATANFSYANSSNENKAGGAAEGKEQASFSASKLFLEEKSSWKSNVDVSPRLGASRLLAKSKRSLGTPGAGAGVEREMLEASHLFCPAVVCRSCGNVAFLDPKGALLKSVLDPKTNSPRWFNSRGEILDYWSKDGTPSTAYIACTHCTAEITPYDIGQCRLYCKKTGVRADEFLDSLPDGQVYFETIAIYLSPLLRVPSDPMRVRDLIVEGLEPQNPSIYQQNKLGHQSETDNMGVSIAEYQEMLSLEAWDFSDRTLFPNELTLI